MTTENQTQWKLVPVEPTPEMYAAASVDPMEQGFIGSGYRAMLNAAPQPPALGGEPETLAVLMLGGVFDDRELGENDIHWRSEAVEALQEKLVTTSDDVYVELVDRAHVARLQAEVERLNVMIAELAKDKDRLDSLEANYWDVRYSSSPIADTGDHSTCIEIVGRWMDKPHERVIGENYNENLRAAIDQAMSADAYPPERPEYPDIDEALAEGDEHE